MVGGIFCKVHRIVIPVTQGRPTITAGEFGFIGIMRSLFIASLMAVAASASNQGESGLAVGTGIEMYHFAVAVALCCPQGVRCGTEADVVSAIEALNAEFEPLRVDFELARLHKFSDVDCLHTNVNEQQAAEILARVHVGGSSTLNVLYLPTALEIDLSGGYARYPPEDPQLRIDQDLEKMDGVRISMNNLYDWKHRVYGKIDPNPHLLPHEVGHWLGLGHDKFTIANLMHPSVGYVILLSFPFLPSAPPPFTAMEPYNGACKPVAHDGEKETGRGRSDSYRI
ncbi:hypothetical protein RJ55_03788 [Drechmeria coniospora]|nr:hypothetical protein RJ55_03788 [Drechmeria coniospora]